MLVQVQKRGLLTLPKGLRDQLHLREGDVLDVQARGDEIVMRPRARARLSPVRLPSGKLARTGGILDLGGDALRDTETYES